MNTGKILLIEDDKKDASGVLKLIQEKGYNVQCVNSGREGLIKAREGNFDLIILDLLLPDAKGEDICSALKKKTRLKNIPIIVLTVKDEIGDIEELFERGADDYIIKPPRSAYLLDKVEAYMAKKRF